MPDREILFRGKRLDDGVWVYGYYCRIGPTGQEKHYIIPTCASTFYGIEVDPSTVSSYVGHTDKSGTEVFGGDILYDPHRRRNLTIRYDINLSMWLAEGDGWDIPLHDLPLFSCKIVGNQWDNPELMAQSGEEYA